MMQGLSPYDQSVIKYYDETRLDYRVLWLNRKNRSVHFGYFEEGIKNHGEALENLNAVMADTVGINAADLVLDAGCGQGGSSEWLAANRGAAVEGITLVPHQVEIARAEVAKRGLSDQVHFTLANYCKTTFPDDHFSVVWACESLCHAEQKLLFYKEAFRVLKPGGRLIVAEYIRTKRPLSEDGEAILNHWLSKWSIDDIDTWAEHSQNISDAGFSNINLKDCSENVMPSLRHLHSMSKKLLPIGKLFQKIGLRNQINHGNHLGSISQYKAFEQGHWFYGIFSASKPEKI